MKFGDEGGRGVGRRWKMNHYSDELTHRSVFFPRKGCTCSNIQFFGWRGVGVSILMIHNRCVADKWKIQDIFLIPSRHNTIVVSAFENICKIQRQFLDDYRVWRHTGKNPLRRVGTLTREWIDLFPPGHPFLWQFVTILFRFLRRIYCPESCWGTSSTPTPRCTLNNVRYSGWCRFAKS